jgi:hypothetical protein
VGSGVSHSAARESLVVRSRWLLVVVVLGLPVLAAACAGDHPAAPTIGSVDFTPRLVLQVDEQGFEVDRGVTDDPVVTADPPSAPEGTVIEIRNGGSTDHRVTDGGTLDTGILRPGDTTTVVLTAEGDLDLHDAETGATITVAVTARRQL